MVSAVTHPAFAAALQGLLTMLSLTVSLGPQNILLLRMGMRRQSLGAVMAICILGDITLIPLGTIVMGYLTAVSPWVQTTLQLGGAAFLLWFAWTCWRDSYKSKAFPGASADASTSGVGTPTEVDSVQSMDGTTHTINAHSLAADPHAEDGSATGLDTKQDGALEGLDRRPLRSRFHRPAWITPAVAMAFFVTFANPGCYLDCVVLVGSLANQFGEHRWAFTLGAMCSSLIWFPAITYGAKLLAKPLSRPVVNKWLDRTIAIIMALIAVRVALM